VVAVRDAGGDAAEVEGVGALRHEAGLAADHAAEADGTHVGVARVRHGAEEGMRSEVLLRLIARLIDLVYGCEVGDRLAYI
jgi:hypothetical protein